MDITEVAAKLVDRKLAATNTSIRKLSRMTRIPYSTLYPMCMGLRDFPVPAFLAVSAALGLDLSELEPARDSPAACAA